MVCLKKFHSNKNNIKKIIKVFVFLGFLDDLPHVVAIDAAKKWIYRYCTYLECLQSLLADIKQTKCYGIASDGCGTPRKEFTKMQPVCVLIQ